MAGLLAHKRKLLGLLVRAKDGAPVLCNRVAHQIGDKLAQFWRAFGIVETHGAAAAVVLLLF